MIRHIDFNGIIDVGNLQNELESPNFPWFFFNDTTNYGSDSSRLSKNTIQHPQLCHTFYDHHGNSGFSHLIMPILSNLDVNQKATDHWIKSFGMTDVIVGNAILIKQSALTDLW